MKPSISLIVILALACLAEDSAFAFHEKGVASCGGCHTMHSSQSGLPINPDAPFGSQLLLKYESATDLCLSCHASSWGAVLGADPLNPPPEKGAGNFVFLLEDNINDGPDGLTSPISGDHAGHNIVSPAWSIPTDPNNTVAPGGSYLASDLGCTSCHDPHGNASYRMLRGRGTAPGTGFNFQYDAPTGDGIDLLSGSESLTDHAAYQNGWTNWCANCHGMYHQQGSGNYFGHPVNRTLGSNERNSYNGYNGPNDPNGGVFATAYIPEVAITDQAITITSTFGASSNSRVGCITCHRAHATSAPEALRWDPNVRTLNLDGAVSGSYPIPNPYPDPAQRPLCVKCHYQASTEHGNGQACLDCHRTIN